ELLEDAGDVTVDGPDAEDQLVGDLAVGLPRRDELHHFELARREPEKTGPRRAAAKTGNRATELTQFPGRLVAVVQRPPVREVNARGFKGHDGAGPITCRGEGTAGDNAA